MPALTGQPFVRAASFKPLLGRRRNVASRQGARGSDLPDGKADIIASSLSKWKRSTLKSHPDFSQLEITL